MFDTNSWQDFLQAPYTLPTLKREYPEWHQGRRRFCIWGILLEQDVIASLQQQAQRWLQDYLLLTYERQPHITLTACGFWQAEAALDEADNFTQAQFHKQLELLDRSSVEPFELKLGGLNSFTTAPFYEVSDASASLTLLRQALPGYFETIREVPYSPHVTVGCYSDAWSTVEVAKRLQAFAVNGPVTVPVNQIALLSYTTDDIGSPLSIEYIYKL